MVEIKDLFGFDINEQTVQICDNEKIILKK